MSGKLDAAAVQWLLESNDPGVKYLALRDLVETGARELGKAKQAAHRDGPIARILENMEGDGYWVEPGPGYYPKYTGTQWSVLTLAQLGADIQSDRRISAACSYLLDHALAEGGQFSINGAPSGTADCMQGDLCWALLEMGCRDARLDNAFEWMARTVTGEGVAPMTDKSAPVRYYAGKCGPDFCCGSNNKLPCAWGAAKVMLAFSRVPGDKRTPLMDRAIARGIDFMFSKNPAFADYPSGYSSKPSGNWWKFGFPVFYVTDVLQIVEALVGLGHGEDPRLAEAVELVRGKHDGDGRWPLEYGYAGKTWVDFGTQKKPNEWVTLRALRVLQGRRE